MGSYVANTRQTQQEMLKEVGLSSFDELFSEIPASVRVKELNLDTSLSEMEVRRKIEEMSERNQVFRHIFRGAGAYHHYIPAIVSQITQKEEFLTAYTPYQAEVSQGVLQSIFEYQTVICELTGMEASNASVYDGATAAAEAVFMCKERKRNVVLLSATVHPEVLKTIETYCFGNGMKIQIIPEKDGLIDQEALKQALGETTACLFVQQLNYYGQIEDCKALSALVHEKKAKFVMGCNPIALALLETPADCMADVAVGEGQPLGMPLSFGGPYLGFMAAAKGMERKLPGRIVGQTTDTEGKRGFVLTLQAREQHIRREKASSNICSNQALCALTASVYLAAMGPNGFLEVARQCTAKAHYLKQKFEEIGYTIVYKGEFFHEFVTHTKKPAAQILEALEKKGYLGGLPLNGNEILWCATEMNTKAEMDEMIAMVKEVEAV